MKQPLPVFPELLEELASSWKDQPYSSRSAIPGALFPACEAMDSLGLLQMPPMPRVPTYLHTKQSVLSFRNPTLPTKADHLAERASGATALNARALNVLSLLLAYQTELCPYPRPSGVHGHPRHHGPVPSCRALCRPGHRKGTGNTGSAGRRTVAQPH